MKKTLTLIFFLFCSIICKAETDTIDVWHVYYNKIKIKEYNEFNKGTITIDSQKYKKGDKITVRHFDDTRCTDCPIFLFVELGKKELHVKANGEGKPLEFDVKSLIEFHKNHKDVPISIYYAGSTNGKQNQRNLLFRIVIV